MLAPQFVARIATLRGVVLGSFCLVREKLGGAQESKEIHILDACAREHIFDKPRRVESIFAPRLLHGDDAYLPFRRLADGAYAEVAPPDMLVAMPYIASCPRLLERANVASRIAVATRRFFVRPPSLRGTKSLAAIAIRGAVRLLTVSQFERAARRTALTRTAVAERLRPKISTARMKKRVVRPTSVPSRYTRAAPPLISLDIGDSRTLADARRIATPSKNMRPRRRRSPQP